MGSDEAAIFAPSSYSPLAADAVDAPELPRVERAWRDAARSLVRRLHLGLSRRWRPASRGRRFDLRRTLRASLQTGGEALSPRWLRRPRRAPRFVLLVDGSRSMSDHARTALQMAVALASATTRVEVFTFSTALQRVTDEVRRAAAGERRRLDRLHHAWAGGTTIGACLRDFLRRFGDRMVGRDTVVMIASDGLDVGAPDMLRDAMRELHRRSAGVVWLNPLLETEGYEPTASGMRAARPYIDDVHQRQRCGRTRAPVAYGPHQGVRPQTAQYVDPDHPHSLLVGTASPVVRRRLAPQSLIRSSGEEYGEYGATAMRRSSPGSRIGQRAAQVGIGHIPPWRSVMLVTDHW